MAAGVDITDDLSESAIIGIESRAVEQEGVIKYQLGYSKTEPCVVVDEIAELNAWRSILHRLKMIGQSQDRYQGYGFGNVSVRTVVQEGAHSQSFVVSGTQTGHLEVLQAGDYCRVLAADPQQNSLMAEGPVKPSSEALTHAAVYAENSHISCVMHVHCPEIWRNADRLGIVATDKKIAYGTPEMAAVVGQLVASGDVGGQGIFAMDGHEDGVVSYAATVAVAGQVLVRYLSLALSLDSVK